jgi:hypothetical protein
MKVHFAEADVVKSKYREIIEGQSVINQNGRLRPYKKFSMVCYAIIIKKIQPF